MKSRNWTVFFFFSFWNYNLVFLLRIAVRNTAWNLLGSLNRPKLVNFRTLFLKIYFKRKVNGLFTKCSRFFNICVKMGGVKGQRWCEIESWKKDAKIEAGEDFQAQDFIWPSWVRCLCCLVRGRQLGMSTNKHRVDGQQDKAASPGWDWVPDKEKCAWNCIDWEATFQLQLEFGKTLTAQLLPFIFKIKKNSNHG